MASKPPRIESDRDMAWSLGTDLHPSSASSRHRGRKGHHKSRRGCFNCKKRKIKCSELFPECENCTRLCLRCQYPQTNAVVLAHDSSHPQPSLNMTPNFSLTDMRLFHHYLLAAYPHFPVASEEIWLNHITPLSHQSDYLMHALLALSASHLNKISQADFTAVAQFHRLQASKGLNEALNQPFKTMEECDTLIGACNALLFQSWYMDDGLTAFLILTRTCDLVSQQVRRQKIPALLAKDDQDARIEIMRGRLESAPSFDITFIGAAVSSINALVPLCLGPSEIAFQECLLSNLLSLSQTPIQAYRAHAAVCRFIASVDHDDFNKLCDADNTIYQLLLAHLVAIHLIMRPISCLERKKYTVTMYSIRMSAWIDVIYENLKPAHRELLAWPIKISSLHRQGKLEQYSLNK